MKKFKLLLLLLSLISISAFSQLQQVKISSFTVKNQLPAHIDNWSTVPAAILLVAQKTPNTRPEGARLVLQIKSGGSFICGAQFSNSLQVDNFTTRTFTTNELIGMLAGCHDLKDGNYSLCAQFFNIDRVAISNEMCREFTVETPKDIDYAPPALITPDNGKEFTEAELQRPVVFRWTPLVPKPKEPITYKLRVWQLMQGQNGVAAMRSNQPVVEKEVKEITQATVTNILTGPCKPPYLCDFIWSIQALNREGKPVGRNNGYSEPWTFKVKQSDEVSPPKNLSPENNKGFTIPDITKPVEFSWTAVSPKQSAPVKYKLRVWQLMQGQNGTQAMRSNKPIVEKEVMDQVNVQVSSLDIGPCKPPYLCDFIWSVQALDREGKPLGTNEGTSEPFTFNVKQSGEVSPPKNVFPENNKKFNLADLTKPVVFKWTGVDPKQTVPVIYKLKVWQLMQGQNGTQAMKTNKPYVERDVTDVNEVSIAGILTGPCKPPYLCDFIWTVQAVTREGKALGSNNGTSEPTMFMANNCDVNLSLKLVSVECLPGVEGNNKYRICVTATYTSPIYALTYINPGSGFAAYHPSYSPTYPVSNVTPALTVQNTGPTTTVNYCVDVVVPIGQTTIKLGLQGDDKDPGPIVCQPGAELDITLPPCKCDACDEKNFSLKAPTPSPINISNNTISFNQSIIITTNPVKTIKSIKAELVYFEMTPENDLCIPCNKDAATYGHFTNGTNSMQWNGPQQNLNISITTPQMVPCCSATFKWCIRYKVEFTDCTTCNRLICYEKKKEGCEKGAIQNPDNH